MDVDEQNRLMTAGASGLFAALMREVLFVGDGDDFGFYGEVTDDGFDRHIVTEYDVRWFFDFELVLGIGG